MPDTSAKIFRDEFPDSKAINKMRVGDWFVWIPRASLRRACGAGPCIYKKTHTGLQTSDTSVDLAIYLANG